MTRTFITRKKFYDIRRFYKFLSESAFNTEREIVRSSICEGYNIVPSTLTKVLQSRNFKEYKQLVNLYSRTMKKLKRRILFILAVIAIVLLFINLK